MPTTHPRINTALEPSLYKVVEQLAKKDGVSLSQKVRDLIKEALEVSEDAGWESLVHERKQTPGKWFSHDEMKRRLKIK